MGNTKPTCFWCKRSIDHNNEKVFILGVVDGKPTQINFHPACAVNANIKLMSRVEYIAKRDKASVTFKYQR
jgi:hypothetical protein